jgi:hypothetical protein
MRKYISNWQKIPMTDRASLPHRIRTALKYYAVWRQCLGSCLAALTDHAPWITFEARDFVEMLLKPEFTVFEYGSGGSTLFYSKRVKQLTSVEHDMGWCDDVVQALSVAGVSNCQCLYVPPEPTGTSSQDPTDPAAYCSSRDLYRGHSFRRYAASIDGFPKEFFDLVSVDGRARPSCVWHAHLKVKVGGYLLLDNSERDHYQGSRELLSHWEERRFYGPGPYGQNFWETTVWKRLKAPAGD